MKDNNENSEMTNFTAGDKFFGQMKEAGIADNDFFREIVEMFLKECVISLDAIKNGFENDNVQMIRLNAHKLKSSFLMFDMLTANDCAITLENLQELTKAARTTFTELQEICDYNFRMLKIKYLNG